VKILVDRHIYMVSPIALQNFSQRSLQHCWTKNR